MRTLSPDPMRALTYRDRLSVRIAVLQFSKCSIFRIVLTETPISSAICFCVFPLFILISVSLSARYLYYFSLPGTERSGRNNISMPSCSWMTSYVRAYCYSIRKGNTYTIVSQHNMTYAHTPFISSDRLAGAGQKHTGPPHTSSKAIDIV